MWSRTAAGEAAGVAVTAPPCRSGGGAGSSVATSGEDGQGSGVEDDDAAGDLAALHGLEAVVDLLQADAPGDQLVELQAALLVQLQPAGDVDPEPVGSHCRPLQLLLHEEGEAGELDVDAEGDRKSVV